MSRTRRSGRDGVRAALENEHYRLTEAAPGAFVLERRARPFAGREDVDGAHQALTDLVERCRPRALLIDVRLAPLTNDPELERSFASYRARIVASAGRTALLLRSKAGRLQAARLAREDGATLTFFDDPDEARAWLLAR